MSVPLVATYRLQLHRGFSFDDAAAIADYLAALGVSHVYASPVLQARPGSTHGYDVVDPRRVSDDLGGREGFDRLRSALREHGLGLVLDVVSNHMAAAAENPWWQDVLARGVESPYARCFDVDWSGDGKVVLPILGQPYEEALAGGELRAQVVEGRVVLSAPGHLLPLSAASVEELSPADPRSVDAVNEDAEALDRLIGAQAYRLVHWREAPTAVNYRRFFDISDLVGLRVEDDEVFELTHGLLLDLVREAEVDGVRVDHVDGLRDPEGYLRKLRARASAPRVWVEKILHPGEELPETWPVDGTTGYELGRVVDGLLVDPRGREPLSRFHAEFTGEAGDFATVVREARLQVLDELFPADVGRLADELATLAVSHFRPIGPRECRTAVRELLAAFPVYRAYVRPGTAVRDEDRRRIDEAAREALARNPELDTGVVGFVRDLLLLRWEGERETSFCLRFQQFSPAVAAKGVEDTALYRYNRLVARNEVGGDPGRFGVGIEEFHRAMERASRRPFALFATSTHDSKRSEGVRCRLAALSELPERWVASVRRWAERNAVRNPVPDRHAEYLLYQTLVGAWPIGVERAQEYMLKAAREAKLRTSWTDPDEGYEEALLASVEGVLADGELCSDLASACAPFFEAGRINALSELLIRLTAPGVPDVYQGTELWSLRLVDPDNRAAVDFGVRRERLARLAGASPEDALAGLDLGLPKLWVLRRALALRRRRPDCFGSGGAYEPIATRGAHRSRVVAFLRGGRVATAVPRLTLGLGGSWRDTTLDLPAGRWRNELTDEELDGGEVAAGRLLSRFPVALLSRGEGS